MKCPKCNKEGLRYKERKQRGKKSGGTRDSTTRESNEAICNKCGWTGVY